MKRRCYNPNHDSYIRYGGRGIEICDAWINDFHSFVKWSFENGYDDNLTLDRIDVNKNYEPGNCQWITSGEQQRNRRDTVYLTINGVTKPTAEWSEISGISSDILRHRKLMGWTEDRMFTPVAHKKRKSK